MNHIFASPWHQWWCGGSVRYSYLGSNSELIVKVFDQSGIMDALHIQLESFNI